MQGFKVTTLQRQANVLTSRAIIVKGGQSLPETIFQCLCTKENNSFSKMLLFYESFVKLISEKLLSNVFIFLEKKFLLGD